MPRNAERKIYGCFVETCNFTVEVCSLCKELSLFREAKLAGLYSLVSDKVREVYEELFEDDEEILAGEE